MASGRALLFIPVMLDVCLRSFAGVMSGVDRVPMSQMSMMRGLLVVACFVMLGGFLVMVGGFFVMFCGLVVMLRYFFGHLVSPNRLGHPARLAGSATQTVTFG